MYVCLCNGYTDRQIRKAAPNCESIAAIYRCLGAEPRCGKCVPTVAALYRALIVDVAAPAGSDD
jgi:bacterioferritin-associated ferredoxin